MESLLHYSPLINLFLLIALACWAFFIGKTDKKTELPSEGKPITGKRTCKVVEKITIGNLGLYIVFQDITEPGKTKAFIVKSDDIFTPGEGEDKSSNGQYPITKGGIYYISDEHFIDIHDFARDGEFKYFASRIS